MASRTPRRTFARPFVVTLLVAPACYTQTASPPPEPPPQQQPQQPPPHVVVVNPPPPHTQTAPADGTKWTVIKGDNGCKAIVDVTCPQGASCNPPPPSAYPCPEGVSLDAPIKIVASGGECMIPPPAVHCPPKAMCNPPPPRKVTCPQ